MPLHTPSMPCVGAAVMAAEAQMDDLLAELAELPHGSHRAAHLTRRIGWLASQIEAEPDGFFACEDQADFFGGDL